MSNFKQTMKTIEGEILAAEKHRNYCVKGGEENAKDAQALLDTRRGLQSKREQTASEQAEFVQTAHKTTNHAKDLKRNFKRSSRPTISLSKT